MKSRSFFIAIIFVAIASGEQNETNPPAQSSAPSRSGKLHADAIRVSIYSLIANPEKYNGSVVRVMGIFYRDASDAMLFPIHESRNIYDAASAVQLQLKMSNGEYIPTDYDDKLIDIEGVVGVDSVTKGGYLKDINYAGLRK